MAHKFKITEVQSTANGFLDTGTSFEWDATTQSSPRAPWEIGVKLRTVREDYPGTDKPTEQVLGFNFEPFTIEGFWDDRYAGQGFAESTRAAFEAMVIRGNLCRFQFSTVKIYGLITEFKPKYAHSNDDGFFRIGYSFTVSPHFKNPKGDLRAARDAEKKANVATADPNRYLQTVDAIVQNTLTLQDTAAKASITGDTYDTIAAQVTDWSNTVDNIGAIIENQVLYIAGTATSGSGSTLSALVIAFNHLASSAAAVVLLTAGLRTDTNLAFESALGNLAFESWVRNLGANARILALQAGIAADDLATRVAPDALALYRPMAGESLYAISNRFYGTPFHWPVIKTRNNLNTFVLTGAELLVIPRI